MTDQNGPSNSASTSGSPPHGGPEFLAVGRIRRPHGVAGMVQMTVYTDFPERLQPGLWVYAGEQHRPLRIANVRWHQEALLIAFEGVNSREVAEELRSELVFVTTEDRPPLPEGEYYHHQLLGLQVKTVEGQLLGILQEIMETGANDVYVIDRPEGGELLLPAIESVVQEVDLDQRVMIVRLLEGLMPGE